MREIQRQGLAVLSAVLTALCLADERIPQY